MDYIQKCVPDDNEVDILAAIQKVNICFNEMESVNSSIEELTKKGIQNRLVIYATGLSTNGEISFLNDNLYDILFRTESSDERQKKIKILCEQLQANSEIPKGIEGISVYWYGIGEVDGENQPKLKEKENELDEKLKEYMNCNDKLEKVISIYNNIFLFITSFASCIILYKVGISIMSGIATYAQVEILLEYSGHLKYNFDWFSRHLTNINKSYISYSKILEFLNNANVEELEEGEELQEVKSIEFADVNFSYDDNQKNIKNFSLYIDSKKKVALTGRTGAGKTTVTGLLCRFYEPVTGQIKINGRDYREYSIKSLREKIGYVMQNIEIFPNTIVDNIRFVNENISREKIVEIFKKLKLHDRVMRLENGYDTNIYDNPDILSTRRKAIIEFCKGNGERVRCYYFR